MAQREAFERHRTPIVIVTIDRKLDYGGSDIPIEDFARAWFDHWEIGYVTAEGELLNQGILLLVSQNDRSARIELGADWGRGWDAYAEELMGERMVPAFGAGNYAEGITEGAWGLLGLAESGPEGSAPERVSRLLGSVEDRVFAHTPLPFWANLLLLLAGLGLLLRASKDPERRQLLLFMGIVLVLGSLVLWILLLIPAMFLPRGDHPRSGGGFGSSGGFGGGGSSGGGGATGRW